MLNSPETKYHTVPTAYNSGQRLRVYLLGVFPTLLTNSAVKKAIAAGKVLVNELPASTGYIVQAGDVISLLQSASKKLALPERKISVVYQDQYLAVVNKPPGLVSSGSRAVTLANYLPNLVQQSMEEDALVEPQLVHRLDKATSGLIIAAKTNRCQVRLGNMLAQGDINKTYCTIVEGYLSSTQIITERIDGQMATTEIMRAEPLDTTDPCSRLFISLHSGRTHQIRRHLRHIEHPIVGDPLYNAGGLSFRTGLMLAAVQLAFIHPITQKPVEVSINLPHKLSKYLTKESDD